MAAYNGLYVFDVYDAVQGGDVTLPSLPFNLNGGTINYESTTYSRCDFGWFDSAADKVLRYALTRKNDGMTLTGMTKLSTYGSYGDSVGLAINGATPSSRNIGPGNVYVEAATTELTEIAIKFSGYVDPIAFWLPGATLVPTEEETRCILYKHTGFSLSNLTTDQSASRDVDGSYVSWKKSVTSNSGRWLDPTRPGVTALRSSKVSRPQSRLPDISTSDSLFLLSNQGNALIVEKDETTSSIVTGRGDVKVPVYTE